MGYLWINFEQYTPNGPRANAVTMATISNARKWAEKLLNAPSSLKIERNESGTVATLTFDLGHVKGEFKVADLLALKRRRVGAAHLETLLREMCCTQVAVSDR